MFRGIQRTLTDANNDDNTNIIVFTGTGDYYCSGNDLGNFMNITDFAKMSKEGRDLLMYDF